MQQAVDAIGAKNIATNQVEPLSVKPQNVAFARSQNNHIIAYMPLAYGKGMQDDVLKRISEAHNSNPAKSPLPGCYNRAAP